MERMCVWAKTNRDCVMCVIDFCPRKWEIIPKDMKFIKIDCEIIQ